MNTGTNKIKISIKKMGESVENPFLNIQLFFQFDLLELVNLEISWLIYLRVDERFEKSKN